MRNVISGVRKFDECGRIVIPSEIKKAAGIEIGDMLNVQYVEGNIIINKFTTVCHCCGAKSDVEVLGAKLCNKCVEEFNKCRELINKTRR